MHPSGAPEAEVRVECREARVKPRDVLIPRLRRGVLPALLALREREAPVQQVADVRENLACRARRGSGLKLRELCRRVADSFAATIGDGCERVSKEWLHRCLEIACLT